MSMFSNALRVGFYILLAAGALACSADVGPDDDVDSNDDEIIAGKTDNGHPAVVGVSIKKANSSSICTGEVVAPHVVLTAAHCLKDAQGFQIKAGTNMNSPSATYAVTRSAAHPNYNGDTQAGYDAAVLVTTNAMPIAPLAFQRKAPSSLLGAGVTIVGYGLSQELPMSGAGTKRFATANVTELGALKIFVQNEGKNQCRGDSGGPTLQRQGARDVIVGVNSHARAVYGGVISCLGSYNTRVDVVAPWIEQQIKAADPSFAIP